ncbi:MAG TPA: hypothetical protein VE544_02335 [Nitrososphaeraceae archaeon]|nr:hypothetical protein [Nitrososphaeraceae archaeon]
MRLSSKNFDYQILTKDLDVLTKMPPSQRVNAVALGISAAFSLPQQDAEKVHKHFLISNLFLPKKKRDKLIRSYTNAVARFSRRNTFDFSDKVLSNCL